MALVVVTLLHQFFRFRSRLPVLATSPQLSHRRQTHAGRLAVGVGVSCPDAKGRVRVGSLPFLDFRVLPRTRYLAVFVGYWAVTSLGRVLPRHQIPCQRESGLDASTLSVMPIRILAQGYYITVFDAIALLRNPIQLQLHCQYPVKPVRPLHITRANSTGPLSF